MNVISTRRRIAENILSKICELKTWEEQRATIVETVDLLCLGCDRTNHEPNSSAFADLFEFGPTEFSLSYSSDESPKFRCLAEVISQAKMRQVDIRLCRKITLRLMEHLQAKSDARFAANLFEEVYDIVYRCDHIAGDSQPDFRFGLGVVWSSDSSPGLKAYFDLYCAGRERAFEKLHRITEHLNFQPQWEFIRRKLQKLGDESLCRGVGMDFSADQRKNLRIYLPGNAATFDSVQPFVTQVDRDEAQSRRAQAELEQFNRLVLNAHNLGQPSRGTLMSLVFADRLPPDSPILKWDICLPNYKPDDLASYRAVVSLAQRLGLALPHYKQLLSILAEQAELDSLQRLHQFLSLDFSPGGRRKLNVYFRPAGLETPHMHPSCRPRRKPALLERIDAAVRSAIMFLESERRSGFADSTHRMVFPAWAGFAGPPYNHEGRTYQTSLICDSLLAASGAGFEIDWGGIDADVRDLVSFKSKDVAGGWKYFPTLQELPPDADDLAQVMQVLHQVGHPEIQPLCQPALDLLFSENSFANGGFSTWIIDRRSQTLENARMMYFINEAWGDTADTEVMANVLFALWHYDRSRYSEEIAEGTQFVIERQANAGFWSPEWYCSDVYGTYVSVRFLQVARPNHPVVRKALKWLEQTQSDDGSWTTTENNATDTALGLLTINEVRELLSGNPSALISGVNALLASQKPEGRWEGSPFIRMDVNRGRGGDSGQQLAVITHGSDGIATSLALKALTTTRPLVERFL